VPNEASGWPQGTSLRACHGEPHRAGQSLRLWPDFGPLAGDDSGHRMYGPTPAALRRPLLWGAGGWSSISPRARDDPVDGFTVFDPFEPLTDSAHRFDCVPACVGADPAAGADAALSRVAASPPNDSPNKRLNRAFAPRAMASTSTPMPTAKTTRPETRPSWRCGGALSMAPTRQYACPLEAGVPKAAPGWSQATRLWVAMAAPFARASGCFSGRVS
jgi:hypothetical protein